MKTLLAFFLSAIAAFAQLTTTAAPASPPQASGGIVGTPGYTTYYYMVIANYPAGSTQSNIVTINNGNATLNSTNYNAISWTAQPNALNYDVLLLTTNSFSGSCTCSVATAQTGTSYNDQSGSKSSYTVGAGAAGGNGQLYIDTARYAFPKLRLLINGADHLAEIASGSSLPSYCVTGDIWVKTGSPNAGVYDCLTPNTWTPSAVNGSGAQLITATVGSGGVVLGQLVKLSNNTVVKTLTTDTAPDIAIGVSLATASAGATVLVAVGGVVPCVADTGGITAGNLIGTGTTVADTCKDLGQTATASVVANTAILGRALTGAAATGTASIFLFPQFGAGTNRLVVCGSTAACPSTFEPLRVVQGNGTLATGSPSTYAVTTISPAFTSASTYTCVAQDTTTIAVNIGVLTAGYVSGTAVTFTGPNTNTDTFNWQCTGY